MFTLCHTCAKCPYTIPSMAFLVNNVDDIYIHIWVFSAKLMSVSSEKCGSSKVWHVCSMAQYHNPYYTSWDWDCQHRETMSSTSSKKHVFNLFVMMFRKICPINPIKILLDKRHIFFINLIRIYSFIWSFVWSMNSEYSLQDTGAQSEIHFKESSWKESEGALFSLSIFMSQYQYLTISKSQYQYLTIFMSQYQYLTIFMLQYQYLTIFMLQYQ